MKKLGKTTTIAGITAVGLLATKLLVPGVWEGGKEIVEAGKNKIEATVEEYSGKFAETIDPSAKLRPGKEFSIERLGFFTNREGIIAITAAGENGEPVSVEKGNSLPLVIGGEDVKAKIVEVKVFSGEGETDIEILAAKKQGNDTYYFRIEVAIPQESGKEGRDIILGGTGNMEKR